MNTRQHYFTRMIVLAAAGIVCAAVWRPELAWLTTLVCVVGAFANMAAGLMVEP